MIDYYKLINSIPEGLNQIEIARFIYIELGKYFIYDSDLIIAQDEETRKKIAYRGINEITNNKVVCYSLSQIYTELLKRCGINAETIYTPGDPNDPKDIGHAFTQIEINGKKGSVDLTRDLANIKVGLKTEFFLPGLTEESGLLDKIDTVLTIDDSELRKIDNKIGYTYNRSIFR